MPAFAQWIGRLAAAFAALLAVVWLMEASPPSGADRERLTSACRRAALSLNSPILALTEASACEGRYSQWNDALVTRGLLAGGAAVVLLILTTLIPKPAPLPTPVPPRPAPLGQYELARRIDEEIADHKRRTGGDLPRGHARSRVEWRHEQGIPHQPPPR